MTQKIWVGGDVSLPNDWNTADNWSPSGVPASGNTVNIPASAQYPITGVDFSGTTLGAFSVDPGCNVAIGSPGSYLKITCTAFSFSGGGQAYIDLAASAIDAVVNNTGSPATSGYGLYLKGSAIATLSVGAGSVGVAVFDGETATVATARCVGGGLAIGPGVTLTAGSVVGGILNVNCAATTLDAFKGTLNTSGTGLVGTATVTNGSFNASSSGGITTLNCLGGKTDTTGSGIPWTLGTLLLQGGKFTYDPTVVTVSAFAPPAYPVVLSASQA